MCLSACLLIRLAGCLIVAIIQSIISVNCESFYFRIMKDVIFSCGCECVGWEEGECV